MVIRGKTHDYLEVICCKIYTIYDITTRTHLQKLINNDSALLDIKWSNATNLQHTTLTEEVWYISYSRSSMTYTNCGCI